MEPEEEDVICYIESGECTLHGTDVEVSLGKVIKVDAAYRDVNKVRAQCKLPRVVSTTRFELVSQNKTGHLELHTGASKSGLLFHFETTLLFSANWQLKASE